MVEQEIVEFARICGRSTDDLLFIIDEARIPNQAMLFGPLHQFLEQDEDIERQINTDPERRLILELGCLS